MLTLPRFFAFTVAVLAAVASGVLLLAVHSAGQAMVKVGETSRNETATRIAAAIENDVAAAERAVVDFERALAANIVSVGDNESVRRYLHAALITLSSLTELTLTAGTFAGYDDDGAMQLSPEGRRQVSLSRDRDGRINAQVVAGVRAGSDEDPTSHDTFRTPAQRDFRGRSLWSDLAYTQLDRGVAPALRRKTLTVQKAIFDAQQRFVGVLRAGIVSDTLDSFAFQSAAGDPHRRFICDAFGRLITRLDARDRFVTLGEDGAPDPDGDLRVLPGGPPPAVTAALDLVRQKFIGGRRIVVADEPHYVTIAPVAQGRAQDWLVGIVVPESHYVGAIAHARDRLLLLMGLVVVVIAVVGLLGARAVGAGMRSLVQTTEGMRRFSFDAAATKSPFREVHDALAGVERAKTALRAMVKYVPVGLVRRLYESGHDPVLGAEVHDVSVMFTDIADFTTHAEALGPGQLADALGRYLQAATAAVESTQGTVDKYIGDALMVLWNVPDAVADHPIAACRAALACAAATDELGRSAWWRAAGLPPWRTRFGLHVDRVLVGHFGAPERLSYTAMGDGVNLAARLEGLNKAYGTTILVSDDLRRRAGDDFVFRLVDRVAVKGKAKVVAVYELMGAAADPATQARRPLIAGYEAALHAAHARDFAGALLRLAPLGDDGPAGVLAARCRVWLHTPPPADWDGSWIASSK